MKIENRKSKIENRIGIMGGTFDPIHYAHLFAAEEARVRCSLDHVLFIPNGIPPHKQAEEHTAAEHRFAVTELATRSNPAFECSRIEIDRAGPSYAVDTLIELHAIHPDTDLFFIVGSDSVAEIITWSRHDQVIRLAQFLAVTRPGFDMRKVLRSVPEQYPVTAPCLDISSSDIRERVSLGLSIRYLTPDPVIEYIRQHRLYGS